MVNRQPKQLLLALLGDYVLEAGALEVRAGAFIAALEATGVAEPATRATLDRMVRTGVLVRERRGREIVFRLSAPGRVLLDDASDRVRGPDPFGGHTGGWTLVTFSLPEDQRALRHRLRSTLVWEGFAPLRDGLWLAPGERDLVAALAPLSEEVPAGALVAFHARELAGFPIGDAVHVAWDVGSIRAEHEEFISTWDGVDPDAAENPLALRTMLVADWLSLLRSDPGLPPEYMDDQWPASRSYALYQRLRDGLEVSAHAQFLALVHNRTLVTPA